MISIRLNFQTGLALATMFLAVLSPGTSCADGLAPELLPVGAQIDFSGTVNDSLEGIQPDSSSFTVLSATTFRSGPISGTYAYAKAAPDQGTISYSFTESQGGNSYTESGNLQITYVQAGTGTYTSSGSYNGSESGFPYNGTFIGSGNFSYSPPSIKIISLQTPANVGGNNTFVSTDTITLQAKINPIQGGVPVKWAVAGRNAAFGVLGFPTENGFPAEEVRNTDAAGISTFSFSPNGNPLFFAHRQSFFTSGSRTANDPVGFDVTVKFEIGSDTYRSSLAEATVGQLMQDETDTLRQEYVDFQIPVPGRTLVVPSIGPGYNQGNYSVQVSVDLAGHFNTVQSAYRGRSIVVNGHATSIPADAGITINSGFRNPRRNIAVGSRFPNSRHTRGQALDLSPGPVSVIINGQRVRLGLHEHLYPALAAASGGIAEQGATPVPVGDSRENHIHVQW